MTKRVLLAVCLCVVQTCAAVAAPCVSETFDQPFPGATDVQSHVSDVPSSRFPAFWQSGRFDGYSYRLFSNGEGHLKATNATSDWGIDIMCDAASGACDLKSNGTPPEGAVLVANLLGRCLTGADLGVADGVQPTDTPNADAAESNATPAAEEAGSTENPPEPSDDPAIADNPCGRAVVNETTDIATLQALLVLAGSDPGPADGFLGPQTFKAMDDFIEDSGWDTSIPDMIDLLDGVLCGRAG